MKKKGKGEDVSGNSRTYVTPSTNKHKPVDIVKGTGGGYSLYYTSLYYSLYYTSLYYVSLYCWVAREVYGADNPQWLVFRHWMLNESPSWFRALYIRHGERFARFISDKPVLKSLIRRWMDGRTEGRVLINDEVWSMQASK